MSFHVLNKYRINVPGTPSAEVLGNNGMFRFMGPNIRERVPLRVIASDGLDWEHVSVSLPHRCPTWEEMCRVKDLFWDSTDCVMQLHPPEADWVNNHSFCLHLWRPIGAEIPRPPDYLVGVRSAGVLV